MRKINRIPKAEIPSIVTAYTRDMVRCEDLAARYGVTRQSVWGALKRAGVDTGKQGPNTWRAVKCATCGKKVTKRRCQVRKTRKSYCSQECYLNAVRKPEYEQWRHGQRLARAEVACWFPLEETHVVHHVDGNNRNNSVSNLMVFKDNSDHMRWHRGGQEESGVVPLFRGDE